MISEVLQSNQINTNADASIKGIGLQKVRAAERLLKAVLQEKKALYCMIEHVDDVLEGNWQGEVVKYTAEQNKSYSVDFSMNSHEIKNSLRIFFDTWLGTVEMSESIQFVFYTNVKFKKENKAGVFKDKEYETIIDQMSVFDADVITVETPGNPRALPAEELAEAWKKKKADVTFEKKIENAVRKSLEKAKKDDVILAFGSLSFLGEIVKALDTIRSEV